MVLSDRHLGTLLVIFLWLSILSGCSLKAAYERTTLTPETVASLWTGITVNEDLIFRSLARVVLESEGLRLVQRGALVMKPPVSLRIEVSPPIGLPHLFLLINEESLLVYTPQRRTAYLGRATPVNLSNFFGVGLAVGQLVPALIGKTSPLAEGEVMKTGPRESNYQRLDIYTDSVRSRSFWIDTASQRLSRTEVFYGGDIIYSLTFSDYRFVGHSAIPHLIEITQNKPSWARLTIEYREPALNVSDDNSDFQLILPAGIRIEKID